MAGLPPRPARFWGLTSSLCPRESRRTTRSRRGSMDVFPKMGLPIGTTIDRNRKLTGTARLVHGAANLVAKEKSEKVVTAGLCLDTYTRRGVRNRRLLRQFRIR